jgi:hypothetical protein
MKKESAFEVYRTLLRPSPQQIPYKTAVAIGQAARTWAFLAERLVFAAESEGLGGLDPDLVREYELACREEEERFLKWSTETK